MNGYQISNNCRIVLSNIEQAAKPVKRSVTDITCVCITKGQPASAVQALIDSQIFPAGPILGENYLQEWEGKKAALQGTYSTHFTGNLQSNKVKKALQLFDSIQTVSSEKLANLISSTAGKANMRMPIFLQVNISADQNKHGFDAQKLLFEQWKGLIALPAIEIKGLMTITRFYDQPELSRPDFMALRLLRDRLIERYKLSNNLLLSMGMSSDYQIAIQEGADIVRIGTAIFGEHRAK